MCWCSNGVWVDLDNVLVFKRCMGWFRQCVCCSNRVWVEFEQCVGLNIAWVLFEQCMVEFEQCLGVV